MTQVLRVVPVLDFGGVERLVTTWADALSETTYSPRVVTFWKPGRAEHELRDMGVPVASLGVDPSVHNPTAPLALASYLRSVQAPLIHSSVSEANFHSALVGNFFRGKKIITEETGIPNRSRSGRFLFGKLYRSADAIIAVSDAVADYLEQRESIPRERIQVIHNCVPDSFFASRRSAAHRSDSGEFRVLAVGRLHTEKNFDGLIRTMDRVARRNPNVVLQIAGDGPEREELDCLVSQLGLQSNVKLLGYRNDVQELLQRSDLFVMPSHSEGLSVALLEAAATGLPILASNRGGNPEVLGDTAHQFGLLLEPTATEQWAKGILKFAHMERGKREQFGDSLRSSVSIRFGAERYCQSIVELYEDLLRAPSPFF